MGTLRMLATVLGVVLVVVGVAGFVPALVTDGNLFGIFAVDSMHNSVHLVSGLIALFAATKTDYSILYFKIFGVIYAVVAVLGMIPGADEYIMMHMNRADNVLHVVIAVVALYFGFWFKKPVA